MKVCVHTLGCKVNQYESGAIISDLKSKGYEIVGDDQIADIYIINTCAVTNEAEKKSRQTVSKFSKLNPSAKIVVCGCSSENNSKKFEVTNDNRLIIGTAKKGEIVNILFEKGILKYELPKIYEDNLKSEKTRIRAFVKVQDGCNNFCSYCIVPYLRGRSRSREIASVVAEMKEIENDVKEYVLTGINLSDYGSNIGLSLKDLILALSNFDARIRLGSLEVNVITEEFLLALKALKNFCPHFHLSLQSGSDGVLKKMNRHYSTSEYLQKVALIRKHFDNSAITTDIICGFPTETDDEHLQTLQFVEKVAFSDVHIFEYSIREGTAASKMMQVDGKTSKKRREDLMALKMKFRNKFATQQIGTICEMLTEKNENGYFSGYTKNYLPCYVHCENLIENEIVKVKVKELFRDGVLVEIVR